MELSSSDIKKIQKYFARQKDVLAVYLYGSFAKGMTHKRSDIDFGVLFNPPIKSYNQLGKLSNDLYDLLGLKKDVDTHELSLNESAVYLKNVITGKLIYSRDELKRIRFEVAVMQNFRDSQHIRGIRYGYMKERLKEGTYGFGPANFR